MRLIKIIFLALSNNLEIKFIVNYSLLNNVSGSFLICHFKYKKDFS